MKISVSRICLLSFILSAAVFAPLGARAEDDGLALTPLWSMLAAPLIAGSDLKNMTPETKEFLTNAEVRAVNQDALGMQARRVIKMATWKCG